LVVGRGLVSVLGGREVGRMLLEVGLVRILSHE